MNGRRSGYVVVAGMLIGAAMSITPLPAWAAPCDLSYQTPVPECEPQPQAPVQYNSWQTHGWAYYCTGDHPYFWGLPSDYIEDFTWDSSCFSVAENYFAEGPPNKFDATITNWCINPGGQKITVTLGCSKVPPPGYQPSCTTVGGSVADPGCKQANVRTFCRGSPPVCFLTYTETCANNTNYECTADNGFAWCQQCAANSVLPQSLPVSPAPPGGTSKLGK